MNTTKTHELLNHLCGKHKSEFHMGYCIEFAYALHQLLTYQNIPHKPLIGYSISPEGTEHFAHLAIQTEDGSAWDAKGSNVTNSFLASLSQSEVDMLWYTSHWDSLKLPRPIDQPQVSQIAKELAIRLNNYKAHSTTLEDTNLNISI